MKTLIKTLRWILTLLVAFFALWVGARAFSKRQVLITANENRLRRVKALKKKRAGLQADADLLEEVDEHLTDKIKKVNERLVKNETKIYKTSDEERAAAIGRFLRKF